MVWEGAGSREWFRKDQRLVVVKGGVGGGEIMIEVVLMVMIGEDEIKLRKWKNWCCRRRGGK